MKTNTIVPEHLRNTACFSKANLAQLLKMMTFMHVTKEETLFKAGEPSNHLYYLKQGRVKATKSSAEGLPFVMAIFQDGDLFGQVNTLNESVHDVNILVVEDSTIGRIHLADLQKLMSNHDDSSVQNDFSLEMIQWMGLQQRIIQSKLRDLLLYGKLGALSSVLIRLSNTYGKVTEGHITITKRLTNSDLAEMIGATRESVNRMLHDLMRKNLISLHRGLITIHNREQLLYNCHCEQCPAEVCRM